MAIWWGTAAPVPGMHSPPDLLSWPSSVAGPTDTGWRSTQCSSAALPRTRSSGPHGWTYGRQINGPSLMQGARLGCRPTRALLSLLCRPSRRLHPHGYADALAGPWRTYGPGVLDLADSLFVHHVASPDVHVDEVNQRFVMYCHGRVGERAQRSRVALSADGIHFVVREPILGRAYVRIWRWDDRWYAIAMGGQLLRSKIGWTPLWRDPSWPWARTAASGGGAARTCAASLLYHAVRLP